MKWWKVLLLSSCVATSGFAKQYQTYQENGKVGMKDEAGKVVLPPKFEALGWSDGSFSVIGEITGYRLQGFWGIINLKKEFVTKAEYEKLEYTSGECIIAQRKINSAYRKTGCLNLKGEVKIPFVYDGIKMQSIRAIVFNLTSSGYNYGLVDLNNQTLLPVKYKDIYPLGTLRLAVQNSERKIGLFSEDGKPITDFSIDSISSFYKGYAIVYQHQLQGLVDRNGETNLETKYSSIKINSDGKIIARLPNEWRFINSKNETIKEILADDLQSLSANEYLIRKGNSWGVVDKDFKIEIPLQYQKLEPIAGGKFIAKLNTKKGVLDAHDKELIPFVYDELISDGQVYRALTKSSGWQLLNEDGKIITDKSYQQMDAASESFVVRSKGFYGMIDIKGKEIIHCVFDSLSLPVNDKVAVKFMGNYGIINFNEDWIIAPQPYPLTVINQDFYLLRQPENQFLKTFSGEIKYFTPYPLKFESSFFVETLPSGIEKKIGYDGLIINRTEVPEKTEEIFRESEGFIGIKKDGRYGFVDTRGKLRIANRYDSIGEFHAGLAPIKLIGKWGFVNTQDKIVVNPNYDALTNFQSGLAIVSRSHQFGLIRKDGSVCLPLRYESIVRLADSFLVKASNLVGLTDAQGNLTIEPRFDSLTKVDNQLLIACRDGSCGVITNTGLNIIPMVYGQLTFNLDGNIFLAEKKSVEKEILLSY
jgi:hypothetical protein